MSYEGYAQVLCPEGHYWVVDAAENGEPKCPRCGKSEAWYNAVDDTNCDSFGEIDMSPFVVSRTTFETCSLGHVHEKGADIYRIPTPEETEKARCYRPDYGDTPLVPIPLPAPEAAKHVPIIEELLTRVTLLEKRIRRDE